MIPFVLVTVHGILTLTRPHTLLIKSSGMMRLCSCPEFSQAFGVCLVIYTSAYRYVLHARFVDHIRIQDSPEVDHRDARLAARKISRRQLAEGRIRRSNEHHIS